MWLLLLKIISEKETQKGKMKNPKVQKSTRCENVKSNNRIIQKMWNIKKRNLRSQKNLLSLFLIQISLLNIL